MVAAWVNVKSFCHIFKSLPHSLLPFSTPPSWLKLQQAVIVSLSLTVNLPLTVKNKCCVIYNQCRSKNHDKNNTQARREETEVKCSSIIWVLYNSS